MEVSVPAAAAWKSASFVLRDRVHKFAEAGCSDCPIMSQRQTGQAEWVIDMTEYDALIAYSHRSFAIADDTLLRLRVRTLCPP